MLVLICFGAAVSAAAPLVVSAAADLGVTALRDTLRNPDLAARQRDLDHLLGESSPAKRRQITRQLLTLLGDAEKAYIRRVVDLTRQHAASRKDDPLARTIELRQQLRTLLEENRPQATGRAYEELRSYWRPPPEIFDADPELSVISRDIVWYSLKAQELGQPVSAPAKRLDELKHQARLEGISHLAPESERAVIATALLLRPHLDPGEFEALMLTNEYRVMMGLHALKASQRLSECARQHSDDMRAGNFFSHRSPTPERRSLAQRARLCGSLVTSENIARDCATGAVAFQRWFNSSPHHRNMLDSSHRTIGVGQSGGYYTQWFSHIDLAGMD